MRILLVAAIGMALVTASPVGVSGGQIAAQEATQPATQKAMMQNDDRQKQLAADTEKLLALATELKQQVDKSNKNTLSLGVIKKADEIEKLAHSLKERMK